MIVKHARACPHRALRAASRTGTRLRRRSRAERSVPPVSVYRKGEALLRRQLAALGLAPGEHRARIRPERSVVERPERDDGAGSIELIVNGVKAPANLA